MSFLSIDFETRSPVDLRKSGVYPYAEHPDTDVWCMSYAVPGAEPKTWFPGDDPPQIIHEVMRRDLPFRAWNASFEHIIWRDIMVPRYGFPSIPMGIWVDTAAEAAALALPRSLAQAARVLGLAQQKDEEGYKLMMKMARPRTQGAWWVEHNATRHGPFATKTEANRFRIDVLGVGPREVTLIEDANTLMWWDDPKDIERLAQYCEDDVRTEMAIAQVLMELPPVEREIYLSTQRMNDRGIGVDMQLVEAAMDLNDAAMQRAELELTKLTGGAVTKVTQVHNIREWVNENSPLELDNLRKDTVRDTLNAINADPTFPQIPADVREVLQIRQDAGKTSTAKLESFLRCVAQDGRAHGLLLYHGASTGRWSGRLIQPQNFPRPTIDVDPLIPLIQGRGIDELRATGESIPNIISSALRSMLIPAPGYEFIAADFSQIEARVLAWLAGQEDLIRLFAEGGKVYEDMASFIFGVPVDQITKDSFERQIGKNSILGAGFQMGADRFAEQVQEQTGILLDRGSWKARCKKCRHLVHFEGYYPTDEEMAGLTHCCTEPDYTKPVREREDIAAKAIEGYRTKNHCIKQFWRDIEDAAITAVLNPGTITECGDGKIRFKLHGQFLFCRLPSGRRLAYAKPEIVQRRLPEPYQDVVKDTLSYRGVIGTTRQWGRIYSYGGHLTENVVQATARDLMAAAILRVEQEGYIPVLTVHDEVVCEQPKGENELDAFVQLISNVPAWAAGLPVAAEGWIGERYRK